MTMGRERALRIVRACAAIVGLLCLLVAGTPASAQDPTGGIEGVVTDAGGQRLAGARVVAINLDTAVTRETETASDGFYRLVQLPVGQYSLTISSQAFAPLVREPVQVNVSQTLRLDAELALASVSETVTVTGGGQVVDTATNVLGRVVSGRELVDLPLNGRNFTQLGLLQTGVAPLPAGLATAGGSLRQGQAYAVNGMRPEQNVYLVDGAQNQNRMDGGYALRLPVDAIAEFRILTQSAPPEYGGTGGATTSVVTKAGGNRFSGSLYEFLRNDRFDARNFFSAGVMVYSFSEVWRTQMLNNGIVMFLLLLTGGAALLATMAERYSARKRVRRSPSA